MPGLSCDFSSSYAPSMLSLLQLVPAEVRPFSGVSSSPALPERWRRQHKPIAQDLWLDTTLSLIDDWNSCSAPAESFRSTAENLTALLASWPSDRRPTIAIDVDGRPSFAKKHDGFYLHLTVDGPNKLSWYAEVGKEELFGEDVPFDGTSLPQDLASVAS